MTPAFAYAAGACLLLHALIRLALHSRGRGAAELSGGSRRGAAAAGARRPLRLSRPPEPARCRGGSARAGRAAGRHCRGGARRRRGRRAAGGALRHFRAAGRRAGRRRGRARAQAQGAVRGRGRQPGGCGVCAGAVRNWCAAGPRAPMASVAHRRLSACVSAVEHNLNGELGVTWNRGSCAMVCEKSAGGRTSQACTGTAASCPWRQLAPQYVIVLTRPST